MVAAGLVGKMNPKNKVDLTNPQLTVIVEVIKAVCCVSVVKDYTLYRKYNVQEVVKVHASKSDKTDPDDGPGQEVEVGREKTEESGNGGHESPENKDTDEGGVDGEWNFFVCLNF